MGPAGKFLDIRQGDRTIEDYAGDFVGMARQSATEKTCLMVIFWGGLADPFKSMMPYWAPEESLEDYINLALQLSGSAFRVELAAEPAPEAAIKGASEASSAAPSTSSPLPERPGLIHCTRDANYSGQQELAEKNYKMARTLNHIGLGIGLVVIVLIIIIQIVIWTAR
ncbi:hypothetical protein G5714_015706 [Onychostoma macrolepis]|uniref:Uncharacterized protein n=1 Tax=Onychostoma macrolepis TaxID=369639 RepID=A0A7J6C7Z3_9TELE|nr:hypothetical protein G5714_015706 [Onychostoma macrolepis]